MNDLVMKVTEGWRKWFWVLLPLASSAFMLLVYRGVGRYSPPDFGGPEPFENHRAAIEILQHGTTTMTFHATGYSYCVALAYLFLPDVPFSMLLMQCGLLPVMVLCIERIAIGFGGERAGRWALIVAGGYYPFAYYAATFSSIVPPFLALTPMAAIALPLLEKDSWKRSAVVGLLLGVAVCCRPNLGAIGIVLFVVLWACSRSLLAAIRRAAPVGVVSVGMLLAMTVANPPEPGQFVRGSSGMNRSLLEATYQFDGIWWDWDTMVDPYAATPFWDHVRRLEAESGVKLEDPKTQLLARRDAYERIRTLPLNSLKKALLSIVRIWIFMPSHAGSMVVKVGIALSELVLLIAAIVGMRASYRRGRAWLLGLGIMLIPTLSHLMLHVEARYSLPARGLLVAFIAVGLATVFERSAAKTSSTT